MPAGAASPFRRFADERGGRAALCALCSALFALLRPNHPDLVFLPPSLHAARPRALILSVRFQEMRLREVRL